MKKFIFFLFCITVIGFCFTTEKTENYVVPNNSIRFRIIANSNSDEDQQLKKQIKDDLFEDLKKIEDNSTNIENARLAIKNTLPQIEKKLSKYQIDYQINYGNNYFPDKTFNGNLYKANNYESLVIKLGNSKGNNFWCILFPPLCLIEAQKEDLSTVKYDFYINKILKEYQN